MNKANDSSYLLTESDSKIIAQYCECSPRQIKYLIAGERGKRQTPLQKAIKRVLEFRTRQNENLKKFCNEIKVSEVTPKASK